jgi:hypothetical protein
MSRRQYGLIAGVASAAAFAAAWWWRSHRTNGNAIPATERGEVIFSNSPISSSEGIL